jgi:hypothetical protein
MILLDVKKIFYLRNCQLSIFFVYDFIEYIQYYKNNDQIRKR